MAEPGEREEPPIAIDRLEGWDAASAPAGFAERVGASWFEERRAIGATSARRRRWIAALAVVAILALGLGAIRLAMRVGASEGGLDASARESVEIGDDAIAVAEPGAELRWRSTASGTYVDQSRGAVFYRVERGSEFEIATPHGTVRVTGTCFTVEVENMGRGSMWKAGAIGAVVAAGIVVTVYEGGVVLARDGREVALAAGERGRVDGNGPRRVGSDGETIAEAAVAADVELAGAAPAEVAARMRAQARELERFRTADAEQRAEIERLSSQVKALGGATPAELASTRVKRCAAGDREAEGCSFVDPDQETLVEMARCSVVKADVPGFLYDENSPTTAPADWATRAGLTPAEVQAIADIGEKFRDDHTDALEKIYADLGGEPDLAAELPSRSLEGLIAPLLDRDEVDRARRQLAKERAGLVDPLDAAAMTVADRYIRQTADIGNRFESRMAEALGAERAHALRVADDGWPGGTEVHSGNCEE